MCFLEGVRVVHHVVEGHARRAVVVFADRAGHGFFSVSRVRIVVGEAAVVVDVERHLVAQSFDGGYLQEAAHGGCIALDFVLVVEHGLGLVVACIRAMTVVAVVIDAVAVFVEHIGARVRVAFVDGVERRDAARGQHDVVHRGVVRVRVVLDGVGERHVHAGLQPLGQVRSDVGAQVVALEA